MAYKIEDINWGKMPASAVEFSLEDEAYFLTWYDEYGDYWDYHKSEWCGEHKYEARRERYKVGDYHPSTNRKPTREERLDKALRALIEWHFFGNGLEWGWKEGKSLEDIDSDLHKEIVDLLKMGDK